MRTLTLAAGLLSTLLGSAAFAADDSSRTYGNPSCSARSANPNDCVIQDGPPRRGAFGPNTPPVDNNQGRPPVATQLPSGPGSGDSGVTIIGPGGRR